MPTFRLIDDEGVPLPDAVLPKLDRQACLRIHETMVRVSEFDRVFHDAQRQGRLSFYFTNRGEEAVAVGSAAALSKDDWLWPQYRELGALFWRGFTYEEAANQCCHNELDPTKGRQLPMHIGSPERRCMYVKSNLGQQVPAANGSAYMGRLMRKLAGAPVSVSVTYFGEGTASEGDVPSALNIAAALGCPTIFICRNNGYAISTHADEQYASDGIAPRGVAYGMPALRIDGNDVLAMYVATRSARAHALAHEEPALIEAMTYRINSHSTSDDDSAYRRSAPPEAGYTDERAYWEARSPIARFGKYLSLCGWLTAKAEEELRATCRARAIEALNEAQRRPQHHIEHLFTDVYDELPWMLREQRDELKAHIRKYPEGYEQVPADQVADADEPGGADGGERRRQS